MPAGERVTKSFDVRRCSRTARRRAARGPLPEVPAPSDDGGPSTQEGGSPGVPVDRGKSGHRRVRRRDPAPPAHTCQRQRRRARHGQPDHRRVRRDGHRGAAAVPGARPAPQPARVRRDRRRLHRRDRAAAARRRLRRRPVPPAQAGRRHRLRAVRRRQARACCSAGRSMPAIGAVIAVDRARQGRADRAPRRADHAVHAARVARPGVRRAPGDGQRRRVPRAAGRVRPSWPPPAESYDAVFVTSFCVALLGRRGARAVRARPPEAGRASRRTTPKVTVAEAAGLLRAAPVRRLVAGRLPARPGHDRRRLRLPAAAAPRGPGPRLVPAAGGRHQPGVPAARRAARSSSPTGSAGCR